MSTENPGSISSFERGQRNWVSSDEATPHDQRDEVYLNMTFKGEAAEFVRDKLNAMVDDTWQLPGGDKGYWPRLYP